MNSRLSRLAAYAVASLLAPVLTAAATPEITLQEGGNLSVSKPANNDRLAFDLVGRIWVMDPRVGWAEMLTAPTEYSRHPAFSSDGNWIAYESVRDGFHQIMLMKADGNDAKQVTFGTYHHLTPAWSPDGLRLVMASDRAGNFDLWELNVETLALRQLTFDPHSDREPNWNADGTKLAFVRDKGDESSILSMRPGAAPTVLVSEMARLHAPSWRPGDRVLTYVRQHDGRSQLRMLILSDAVITKPMTHGENVHPYPARWIDHQNFFYTADGKIRRREFGLRLGEDVPFRATIEVRRDPYPVREQDFDDTGNRPVAGITGMSPTGDGRLIVSALSDIWELSADGTLLRQLTNDAFVDTHPSVSPAGKTLAFVSDRSGTLQIWLMDLESKRARRLTFEEGIVIHPAWDSASTTIAFLVARHPAATKLTLKRIDVGSRTVEVLAEDVSNSAPPLLNRDDWSVPLTSQPIPHPESDSSPVPLTWRPFTPEGRFIIRAGRIFDGIGPGYLTEHEILIEANRIAEVRPWTSDNFQGRVIDATEHTVIPGLIDLSVQQTYASDERLGRIWLSFGVTTIRESVSNLAEATERQESWRSGHRIGPRLYMAINPCSLTRSRADLPALTDLIAGVAKPHVALIELCPSLGSDAYRRLIAAAHAANLPVAVPTPFPGLLLGANEVRLAATNQQRQDMMLQPDGANYADVVNIVGILNTTIVSRLANAGLAALDSRPALAGHPQYRRLFTPAERRWYGEAWDNRTGAARRDARAAGRSLLRAMGQGARIVTGSAAPLTPYGLGLQAELQLLAETGLQPFQILKMTSLDAARVLGAGDDLGSIKAGKLADLVIVDGDPLADVGDAANVVFTIINGRPYGINELARSGGRAGSVGKLYN